MCVNNAAITETIAWVETFVIGHGLCPFAKYPHENKQIHYETNTNSEAEELIQEAFNEVLRLDNLSPEECSTSFYIIDSTPLHFEALLDIIDILEQLLSAYHLSSSFQLVPFHPEFRFQGQYRGDSSNLVNQSPYPMIHILRTEEVEKAMKPYRSFEQISKANDITLQNLEKDKS